MDSLFLRSTLSFLFDYKLKLVSSISSKEMELPGTLGQSGIKFKVPQKDNLSYSGNMKHEIQYTQKEQFVMFWFQKL